MEKRLYRSEDKKLCGVCAGVAEYFNIDPTIIRIIVAELAFFTAVVPALVVYLIVALVIPKAPEGYVRVSGNTRRFCKGHEKKIAGVCSGVAEYFDIDPTIVRLALLLLFLVVGNGLYTYIALAWILPTAPDMQQPNMNGQYQPPYGNGQFNNPNNQPPYANPYQPFNNSQNEPNCNNGQNSNNQQ